MVGSRKKTKVVHGDVYGPKFSEPLDIMMIGGVMFFLAMSALVFFFGSGGRKQAMKTMVGARLFAYVIVGLLMFSAAGLVALFLMVRWRRLVIGKDRVQLVAGFGRVIGQIPLANIDEVSNGNDGKNRCYIRLKSRRHKGTWWPKSHSELEEFDIMIPTNLESDATAVHLHLRDALLKIRNHIA